MFTLHLHNHNIHLTYITCGESPGALLLSHSPQHLEAAVLHKQSSDPATPEPPSPGGFFISFCCGCSWPRCFWPAATSPSPKLSRQPQPAAERLQQSWGGREEKGKEEQTTEQSKNPNQGKWERVASVVHGGTPASCPWGSHQFGCLTALVVKPTPH